MSNDLKSDIERVVSIRLKKTIIELIDKEKSKFNAPRTTWITQAIIEKLERLGYEID